MDGNNVTSFSAHGSIDVIQAMRGVAALIVVLYHASRFISPYYTGLGWMLFGGGSAMGVEMFFVLSGFIMVYTTTRGPPVSTGKFLLRRFLRVWPLYMLGTGLAVLMQGYHSINLNNLIQSLTFIPVDDQPPLLGVGWTLNFEIYFYFVFGLCMLLDRFRWPAFFAWIALTLIVLPLMTSRTLMLDGNQNYQYSIPYVNLMTSPLIWLFTAGVTVGLIYRSRIRFTSDFWARLTIFTLLACTMWHYSSSWRTQHGIDRAGMFVTPLTIAIIIASKSIHLKMPRWLVYLGDISFSVYLLHPLVQGILEQLLNTHELKSLTSGLSFVFLTTCLTISVSALSHRYIEMTIAQAFRQKTYPSKVEMEDLTGYSKH
jgi:exopolysaccharide production protein ExoZ